MKTILICGDSFAADWTVKYHNRGKGWPNLLAEKYAVTNVAEAGCGEYKIYKQLISQDLDNFDCVIISHTSAYRLHTLHHPVHNQDLLHYNADFIYSDIKEHAKTHKQLDCVVEYYEKYFDTDYARFVHELICEKINQLCKDHGCVLHLTDSGWSDFYQFPDMLVLDYFKPKTNGINHYDQQNNIDIYQKVLEKINL